MHWWVPKNDYFKGTGVVVFWLIAHLWHWTWEILLAMLNMQEALVLQDAGLLEGLEMVSDLSEGQIEAKLIAMDAVRSKVMLQNQLLIHQLGRRSSSISRLVKCD